MAGWLSAIPAIAGLAGSLLGGKSNQAGSSSTTETYDITDATKGTTAVRKGTAGSDAAIANILNVLTTQLGGSSQYSKASAVEDSRTLASGARNRVLDEIGGILSSQAGGGAYSSTGTRRQIADTADRAAVAEASVVNDTIAKYAAIDTARQQQVLSGLLGAIGAANDSNTLQSIDSSTKKTGTVKKVGDVGQSGKNSSGLASWLGGSGVSSILNGVLSMMNPSNSGSNTNETGLPANWFDSQA